MNQRLFNHMTYPTLWRRTKLADQENKAYANRLWIILLIAGALALISLCVCILLAGGVTALIISQNSEPALVLPTPGQGDEMLAQQMLDRLDGNKIPQVDPFDLAQRFNGVEPPEPVLAQSADALEVGAQEAFWIINDDTGQVEEVEAELASVTDHVYFWIDSRISYQPQQVDEITQVFEDETYPRSRAFLGSEWTPGVDGDPHLYMLYARDLGSSVAGYFSPRDEYHPIVQEYSNGHEMFYLNADALDLEDDSIHATLAHEFQHMIHWNLDRNEETWMNEGFSVLSELINGYDDIGFDVLYAHDPDQPLTHWPDGPGSAAPNYGMSFLFMTYFYDRFGPDITKALISNPSNGLISIDQTLQAAGIVDPDTQAPLSSEVLFRDWAVSLALQDLQIGEGRYGLQSYAQAPVARPAQDIRQCPMDQRVWQVNQYGVDLIKIRCSGEHTLHFQGVDQIPVLPVEPHSGEYAMWSGRGDDSHMLLTHTFDLSGVDGAIELAYWTWFDLEDDYDYLYLTVSADGGETWTILRTPSSTDSDPYGNSYGWGYSGNSGEEGQAQWIEESVDLSAYAGAQVQLRFEYITDAAVNGEGFLLDDVSIPAIAYQEDFENGSGGWQTDGFLHLYNRIPQSYQLALITRGEDPHVIPIELDAQQRAQVDFHIGDSVQDLILVVTGTARHTWQAARYAIEIEP